jgi:hypothetical protein
MVRYFCVDYSSRIAKRIGSVADVFLGDLNRRLQVMKSI